MSTVAFWSPVHGQAGNTANLIATSSMLAVEHNNRTMVTQTQLSHSTLESAFTKRTTKGDLLNFSDTGIDALERLARSKRLTDEKVSDYTISVINGRLELLVGSSKPSKTMYENIDSVLDTIFTVSSKFYDFCMVDVHSGTQNKMTRRVLDEADLIVVNLNQNVHVLDRFFNKEDWIEVLDEKPYVIVLSQYDPNSHYSVKNIQRKYKCKKPILTVPYNTAFRDACNNRDVVEFFLRTSKAKKNNQNHFFVTEVQKLIKEIMKQTQQQVVADKVEEQSNATKLNLLETGAS